MPATFLVSVIDSVRRIKALGRRDAEAAHGEEDKLYERILREIAGGDLSKAEAVAYASEALKTKDSKFPRWKA
jgi:hypothetical protein